MKRTILKKWMMILIIILLHLNIEIQGMENEDSKNCVGNPTHIVLDLTIEIQEMKNEDPKKYDNKSVYLDQKDYKILSIENGLARVMIGKKVYGGIYDDTTTTRENTFNHIADKAKKLSKSFLPTPGLNEKLMKLLMKENNSNTDLMLFCWTIKTKGKISRTELIKFIMKKNDNKYLGLHHASEDGQDDIVKLLLETFNEDEKDKFVNYVMKQIKEKSTITVLHRCSFKGHEEIVKLLLDTFNEKNKKDQCIEYLMSEMNIPKENYDKWTALHIASFHGHEEIVKLLLNAFNLDKKDQLIEDVMSGMKEENYDTWTILHRALAKGHERNLRLDQCIEYVMKEDSKNCTALHYSSNKRNGEGIVKLLLDIFHEEKKDELIEYVMKINYKKYTALHYASKRGNERIIKLLLDAFNHEDKKDELFEYLMKVNDENLTALNIALLQRNKTIVKLLLNAYKKEQLIELVMKEINEKKYTVLHFASLKGHEEIIKLLLGIFSEEDKDKLIEFMMKEDCDRYTALHHAYGKGHTEIVKLLLKPFNEKMRKKFN